MVKHIYLAARHSKQEVCSSYNIYIYDIQTQHPNKKITPVNYKLVVAHHNKQKCALFCLQQQALPSLITCNVPVVVQADGYELVRQ